MKDPTKGNWERRRDNAISIGKRWVDHIMEVYTEPTRFGTPKGDPIGFSAEKQKAALLMVLYSPTALSLKEIAAVAKVSEGVLRVWRTRDDFQRVEKKACLLLGELIRNSVEIGSTKAEIQEVKKARAKDGPNTLSFLLIGGKEIFKILKSEKENPTPFIKKVLAEEVKKRKVKVVEIDDSKEYFKRSYLRIEGLDGDPGKVIEFWGQLLPFFNLRVAMPLIGILKERIDSQIFGYLNLAMQLRFSSAVKDERSLKKWNNTPMIKKITKHLIEGCIDLISDPDAREQLGAETIQTEKEKFKNFLFSELNL